MCHCLLTLKLEMLTKEDKILIKNAWESKKYGVRQLIMTATLIITMLKIEHCNFDNRI